MLPCLSPERFFSFCLQSSYLPSFPSSGYFPIFFFFERLKHWCFQEALWASAHPSPALCCCGNLCLSPSVCARLRPLAYCVCFCLILQLGACCKIGIQQMFGESLNILIWSRFCSSLRTSFLGTIGTCVTGSYLEIRKWAFTLHSEFYIYWFF